MAIVKLGTYRNPPVDITDYEAIVAHLEAYTRQIGNQGMILTEWTNNTTAPKIAMGSYISHGGVLYVVEDEDYGLPALSSDGTYYLRVSASGDTLAITYTTNIADYSWNAVYGGLYHADESQVLPYQVVKNTGASTITKYKMLNPWQVDDFVVVNYLGVYHGRGLSVTGAISGASLTGPKTVDHSNETNIANGFSGGPLHLNYRGASSPITELRIDNGMSDGGLIPVSCSSINFTSLNPDNSTETSVQLSAGDSQVLPKGAYAISIDNTVVACQMKYGSNWITIFVNPGGFVISDGVNFRLSNTATSGPYTTKIRKW